MKKWISVIMIMCIMWCCSACGEEHIHTFHNATCEEPKTCECGETQGSELGHRYRDASCDEPAKCSRCATEDGEPLGHDFSIEATCNKPAKCSRCATEDGEPLGHDFSVEATCNEPTKCSRCATEDGEPLGHKYINDVCERCEEIDPESIPVQLNTLFVIDSYEYKYKEGPFTDSFGNTYDGVHYFTELYEILNGRPPHLIANLNEEYKTFSGSIVASTKTNANYTYFVSIYVDDVLVCSKTGISKTSGKVDFSANIEGGKVLKIVVGKEGDGGAFNQEIGIVNAELKKK